jgi:hypothetical protein
MGPAWWVPINGARGRRGHSAHPWPAPATRRLVARFPGLLWEVLPGALGGQVWCIPSAPTTQGDGGNPQVPPGKPPGAHPNSPGKQLQPVETTCSRQLCTCKLAALETIEHFHFECAAYAAVRQPLTDAATDWCKLSAEHTFDIDMGGVRQALLWAATDPQLLTPNGRNTAGDDLRKRALEFALCQGQGHPPQQVHRRCYPAHAKRLAPQLAVISMAMPSWRYRPRPSGRQFPPKKETRRRLSTISGNSITSSTLVTPNIPNTAGDDLRGPALEFYAKAKAIRHNKSLGAAAHR